MKLTGKGKHAPSYIRIDGNIVSVWIYERGGVDHVVEEISKLILNECDIQDISHSFNISYATCKRFVLKYCASEIIDKFLNLNKTKTRARRSKGLKGLPSKLKGKSYLEIHGTKTPTCGFKRGYDNPNYTRSKFVGRTKSNSRGETYRSSYEIIFSDMMYDANISYEYENNRIKLGNGKIKVVDFTVGDILVEITGYAYAAWKHDFDGKIALLKQATNSPIMLIAPSYAISEISNKHSDERTHIFDITDSIGIVAHIKQFKKVT